MTFNGYPIINVNAPRAAGSHSKKQEPAATDQKTMTDEKKISYMGMEL